MDRYFDNSFSGLNEQHRHCLFRETFWPTPALVSLKFCKCFYWRYIDRKILKDQTLLFPFCLQMEKGCAGIFFEYYGHVKRSWFSLG